MFNNFFPPKIVPFMRYVEMYGRAGQATNDIKMSPMRLSCWIPKATNTHSKCVKLSSFPRQLLR